MIESSRGHSITGFQLILAAATLVDNLEFFPLLRTYIKQKL